MIPSAVKFLLRSAGILMTTAGVCAQEIGQSSKPPDNPSAVIEVVPDELLFDSLILGGTDPEPAAQPATVIHDPEGVGYSMVDWTKVPPITSTPRAGWFTIRPSGPGYYTVRDWISGELRQKAPPAPFGLTSSDQTPSFDHDFRYLDKPDNAYHLWTDFNKRVEIRDEFLFSSGGEARYRFNDYTNSSLTGKNDTFNLTRFRAYGDLWYRDKFRAFAELIDARSYDQDLPPASTDVTGTDLLNAFVELQAAELAGSPVQVRGGRQEIVLGSQRLIASPDFSNTLRTYDGLRGYRHSEKWSVDLFWVRPVVPNPNQFDSSDNQRAFSGLFVTHRPNKNTLIDVYLLNLNDTRPATKGDTTTFGARVAGDKEQRLLYDFEGMAQTGSRAERTINAQAATAGLGWHFADLPGNISYWTYFDWASGTPDPAAGVDRTFNQLFPAGHTYFGYLDLVGRQNIEDLNFQLESNPEPWLQLRLQYHIFRLAAAKDALYNASGSPIRQDPTGAAGNDVGDEIDFLANFHLSPNQDVLMGFSKLFAGDFIRATGPASDPTYFYTQYTFRW